MSKTIKSGMDSFLSGFFGSFKLAAAIVMAIVGVAAAFVNGTFDTSSSHHADRSART
jgi:hypothetical protein